MPADVAAEIGDDVLAAHKMYIGSEKVWRDPTLIGQRYGSDCSGTGDTSLTSPTSKVIDLSIKHAAMVKEATDKFSETIPNELISKGWMPHVSVDFLVGVAGGGAWHIDPVDYRVLVNLSRHTRTLQIANAWSSQDFDGNQYTNFEGQGLASKREITYGTGEALSMNNLNPDPLRRQPHRGVPGENKVMMRIIAFSGKN